MQPLKYIQVLKDRKPHGHYYRRGKYRVSLPQPDSPDFMAAYKAADDGFASQTPPPIIPKAHISARTTWHQCLYRAMKRAGERAASKRLPFTLTVDDVRQMFEYQDGKCAVSGVRFKAYAGESRVNPYQPSIDRVEPPLGYVQGNVRLVLHAVNVGLSDMPLPDYVDVCAAVARKHRGNVVSPR